MRANGRVDQPALDRLRNGITVEGVRYGPIEATLERQQGANVWLMFSIREGKNREVRKVLETLGLRVNRLIRVAYGPFQLGELAEGAVKEIETAALRTELGEKIVAEANADFDAPLVDHDLRVRPSRHAGKRPQDREPAVERRGTRPPLDSGPRAEARDRNDNEKIGGVRNQKKKQRRRDRSGGPRPKYPRARA